MCLPVKEEVACVVSRRDSSHETRCARPKVLRTADELVLAMSVIASP